MKCLVCDCLFPNTYKNCPVCGNHAVVPERFAPQQLEIVEVEPISAEVITAEITIGEIEYE